MKKLSAAALSLLFVGCGDRLDDPRHPTGSQTIATSSDYSALYIANSAEQSVTRLPIGGEPIEVPLEGEPSRIARVGDRVFVTLRAARSVAVMLDDGDALVEDQTIATGAEPMGIVASEDGTRIFVAASLEGRVYEYDASSLSELRSWEVKDEPRWLALHPSNVLYVGSAYNGTFTYIDLDSGKAKTTRLPPVKQLSNELDEEVELDRRITGDIAISADGEYLAIPAMYFDTKTPVVEPDSTVSGLSPEERPVSPSGGYASSSTERFNPVVAMVQIEGDGEPQIEDAELVRLASVNLPDQVEGYPASVTISPDGATTYVTIEGGQGVVAFPTRTADDNFDSSILSPVFNELGGATIVDRTVIAAETDMGPRGIAFTDEDQAFVYNFLDRTVQEIDVRRFTATLYEDDAFGARFTGIRGRPTVVTSVALDAQIDHGRRLFYSSADSKMSAGGVGLSCATCHFDGRADGLTWMFDRGPRQTPSLAGKVSLTEPVRWAGERATVAEDVLKTSQGLMGGSGITEEDIAAVAAFVDSTRDVDAPLPADDPDVLAGKAIFERGDVGCISCHNGPRFTNNQKYDMFGFEGVNTPGLVGISGSPPYFHDGSAKTLRDVLERARSGEMGNTSRLSEEEMRQLEAYLRSL